MPGPLLTGDVYAYQFAARASALTELPVQVRVDPTLSGFSRAAVTVAPPSAFSQSTKLLVAGSNASTGPQLESGWPSEHDAVFDIAVALTAFGLVV